MKTLLIDVDGTILDSFSGIKASFLHALEKVNWPPPEGTFISGIAGPAMESTFASLDMDETTRAEALRHYMAHHGDIGWAMCNPYPGVRELLDRLRDAGFRLCTATAKTQEFAIKALTLHDLVEPFAFIGAASGPEGHRRGKKAVIAHVLDSMQLRGYESDILMVGDRIHDITGAATFNIPTVAVNWGYGTPDEYEQARFTAATIEDLERTIHAWASA